MGGPISFKGISERDYEFPFTTHIDRVLTVGAFWWMQHNVLYVVYEVSGDKTLMKKIGYAPGEAAEQIRALGSVPGLDGLNVALRAFDHPTEGDLVYRDLREAMLPDA